MPCGHGCGSFQGATLGCARLKAVLKILSFIVDPQAQDLAPKGLRREAQPLVGADHSREIDLDPRVSQLLGMADDSTPGQRPNISIKTQVLTVAMYN